MASRFSLLPPQVEARSLPAIGWSHSVVLLREAVTVDRLIGPIVQRPALSARPLQRAGRLHRHRRTRPEAHAQAPRAFAEHPLLRRLQPLPRGRGCLPLGRLTVRLDDKSGLVYQGPLTSPEDQA
ncbi:hypothetical protein SAMN04244573_03164 [Azotobacter beijerinckii]|uniref:Uncharacterized protein n=1 Tax=Azotobacter beijerinckii TaxID=170623 RepID=A0A1H9MI81_9GAMM|nr:hypothetical protein [Azotobacter beijerinckii]SER23402.1 hypothetical protein SAMN04244573_03164 [Azotobacter beijerinckii]